MMGCLRKFVMVIAIITMLVIIMTAIAEPRLSYIYKVEAALTLTGSNANASGYIMPQDGSNRTAITVKLQRRNEVGKWITVATWTNSGTGKVSAGGTRVTDGSSSYRVSATGKVLDSNGNTLETATAYSSIQP